MSTAVLVGRPNVGKSTLFNRLTRQRQALVADVPGLTRDRRYGRIAGGAMTLIDTGGLLGEDPFVDLLSRQVDLALDEADLALWLVDARDGLMPADYEIADLLRRRGIETILVINKTDGLSEDQALADFAELGFPTSFTISASQGRGITQLMDFVLEQVPEGTENDEDERDPDAIYVALVGRPNVGKSTLTNRLLGEERQVVFDAPGTTRDAIDIPLERSGQPYVLIDTAGVRRKGKTDGIVEKFSVVKTLDAIERAHVVLLVVDAREGLVEQDLHLLGYALEAGRGILLCVNKWDGLPREDRDAVRSELDRRLNFAAWIPHQAISALKGTGVGKLWPQIRRIHKAGLLQANTTRLTGLLESMVQSHAPPSHRGRLIKLRFAHPGGSHPPTVTIHGNQTAAVPDSYIRYLENGYRAALKLYGNPVRIKLKTGDNPFAGKSNPLSDRQRKRRGRMIEHRKKTEKRKAKKRR